MMMMILCPGGAFKRHYATLGRAVADPAFAQIMLMGGGRGGRGEAAGDESAPAGLGYSEDPSTYELCSGQSAAAAASPPCCRRRYGQPRISIIAEVPACSRPVVADVR